LLRHGMVYSGGDAWTAKHDAWMRTQRFEQTATRLAFESDYDTVTVTLARRDRLDEAIEAMAADSEFTAMVRRPACLRGISTLTGFALAVELGDWSRFTGNTIGSFVGLVPSEYSSGSSRSQGPITKAGNRHLRRLLVEAAWHHRKRYRPGRTIKARWALAPTAAVTRADAGNRRLAHRRARFDARDKKPVIANVAIARELASWCWSLAIMDNR
jgi:transposase